MPLQSHFTLSGLHAHIELAERDDAFIAAAIESGTYIEGPTQSVAGIGVCAVIALPTGLESDLIQVSTALKGIPTTLHGEVLAPHSPIPSVTAMGSFDFDPKAPTHLFVARETHVMKHNGPTWRIRIDGEVVTTSSNEEHYTLSQLANGSLHWLPSADEYEHAVSEALKSIENGQIEKVVLSRSVACSLSEALTANAILRHLGAGATGRYGYALTTKGVRLVGVSPEVLIARSGRTISSHAFAGTVALGEIGDQEEALERLVASVKDQAEHRLVVDAIAQALSPFCDSLQIPQHATPLILSNDARLGTLLEGHLSNKDTDALSLLASLHPTPAVGGVPKETASALIKELEPLTRGPWAGAVGWIDGSGDGEWILAIRNVLYSEGVALIRAGAGIVKDSTPASEEAETALKLTPVLSALGITRLDQESH